MLRGEDENFDSLVSLARALEAAAPAGFVEWVLGYRDLLLLFDGDCSREHLSDLLSPLSAAASPEADESREHEIAVSYDGPDLEDVATAAGLSPDEVVERHTAPVYRVRFLGFAPGFAYLDGLDPALHLPRRPQPRPRMEPGAVAIGGAHAGVYPIASPGGWHWLGRTNLDLFRADDPAEPFRLRPGDRVRFVRA